MLLKIYLGILLLSFGISLLAFFRKYPVHLRFFSVLIGLAVITEFIANFGPRIWGFSNNMPVYNIYRLFEFTGYAVYYYLILKNRMIRKSILAFLVIFPVYWYVSIFLIFGINAWASYLPLFGNTFTVFVAASYCYQVFRSDAVVRLDKNAEFWIAIGMIIYYACDLPYEGLLNYLWVNYGRLARGLMSILLLLNILMYSMFIYAYLCRINFRKSTES